ncbi:MAG: hypothetical protein KF716_30485 [Anaerolineae bacterium]|nr:hypothetical protein [Anaerolineae bacterium]
MSEPAHGTPPRRELWETLTSLMDDINRVSGAEVRALADAQAASDVGLVIDDVTLDVPVEITIRKTDVGFRLFMDLPAWRYQSGFVLEPGRMRVRLILSETLPLGESKRT